MEKPALYSVSSDSEDISLDNCYVHRLTSLSTDTDDTSDGSDDENRTTRLETDKKTVSLPETPQKHNGITSGKPEVDRHCALTHNPSDTKTSPKSTPTDTKHTRVVPPSGESGASPAARDYSPEDDNELFSHEYVDELVASFWNKVDKKIETAVSQYHSSPQAGQQCSSQDNTQTKTTEAEDKPNEEKCPLSKSPGGVCVFVLFIFQFIKKILVICKENIKSKAKEWFPDGTWRENVRAIITHRHANFTVVMLTMMDCFLVTANILADFGIIDDQGIEFIFTGFLFINLAVMVLFLFECFLRIIVLRRDLFQDKMEGFDVVLVIFYFLVEVFSSNGFSDVGNPYPKYLHMIVILRCWRVLVILEQLKEEKEAQLVSALENQTPR